MAQVVRPQGFIAPLVILIVGIVLLFNGVPALFQWISWIAQSALVIGVEGAMDEALVPLLLAGLSSFVGLLMVRGGWSALMKLARSASSRAQQQVRTGVQQVRREVDQRYTQVTSQAEHLQNQVPQSWRERIEAAAQEVEHERARRSGQQPQVHAAPQQQRVQQYVQQQRAAQVAQQRPGQQQRPPQPAQAQAQPQPQRQQQALQAPGADRLQRIEDLKQRTGERAQQLISGQVDAWQAAHDVRRAAHQAAKQAQQAASVALPMRFDESTQALVGRLDSADAERMTQRGSTLTRSSLRTSSLAKTSLTLNSLLQSHR